MLRPTSDRWRSARARAGGLVRRVRRDEAGNTMILYPFGLLVLLAVGGLALDTAIYFQAHREAVDVAAGLASDVAGVVDEAEFATNGGRIVIDVVRADAIIARRNLELATHPNQLRCTARLAPLDPATVDVECTGTARPVLGPASIYESFDLRGTASASAAAR